MPFSKRKPRRTPLQRLNDQRRSLALAGLAAGAVLSAAVFRRRRHGVQDELREQVPVAERPVVESAGSPLAVAVPPSVSEPGAAGPIPHAVGVSEPSGPIAGAVEVPEAAINAAPIAGGAGGPIDDAGSEPAADQAFSPTEPATGELSAEEASILAVLAQSGRVDDDRTALAVATSLERDSGAVTTTLRKLGAEGVVSGELYTAAGDKIWAVTERGVRRLGAQS